jgi:hypothetical protein
MQGVVPGGRPRQRGHAWSFSTASTITPIIFASVYLQEPVLQRSSETCAVMALSRVPDALSLRVKWLDWSGGEASSRRVFVIRKEKSVASANVRWLIISFAWHEPYSHFAETASPFFLSQMDQYRACCNLDNLKEQILVWRPEMGQLWPSLGFKLAFLSQFSNVWCSLPHEAERPQRSLLKSQIWS